MLVKGFHLTGATLIGDAELQAQLTGYLGQELSFKQLQAVAVRLIGYYAQKGYLARVFLAPQAFTDGIVTLTVVEGKVGAVDLKTGGARLDAERAKSYITTRIHTGDPLSFAAIGEAIAILNEQPGVSARSALKAGQGEGAVDLTVTANETPLTTYSAQVDNQGPSAIGEPQARASVTLHNPGGRFDQATLLANATEGMKFVSGDYSQAVGPNGLRLGANVSWLDYHVTQDSLSALDAHGGAKTVGVYASYPLKRQLLASQSVSGSFNYKTLQDYASGAETGDRRVTTGVATLSGWFVSAALGVLNYDLSLTVGKADLSGNADALTEDLTTRDTDGTFGKLAWHLGEMLPLGGQWNLVGNLRGQFASRNLDSTERFGLGGPSGVRAYPNGEAAGDEGWLLTLDLVRPITATVTGRVFVDYGQITLNKHTWTGWNADNTALKNHYALSGVGVGADWKLGKGVNLNATLAAPLGNNPGRDSNGLDADGRSRNLRLWIGLMANI